MMPYMRQQISIKLQRQNAISSFKFENVQQ